MLKNTLFFLFIAISLSACVKPLSKIGMFSFKGTNTGSGSGSGTGSGSGASDTALGLFVRGEGLGILRSEIKSLSGGTVQLEPGRVHGLIVENGDQVRQALACNTGTQNNVLYVSVPAFTSGGSQTYNCTSGSNSFSLNVAYGGGAKLALVAEKVAPVSQSAGTDASAPSLSSDGRYHFYSVASPSHNGISGKQIVRFDSQTGLKRLVSSNASGVPGNGHSTAPSASADGRYVAFLSSSTNLVADLLTGTQIYRKDLQTEEVILISTPNGTDAANGPVLRPRISADGSRVVFQGTPANFFGPLNDSQIFLRNVTANSTLLISSVDGTTPGSPGDSYDGTISGDGNHVSFTSGASLVGGAFGTHVYRKTLDPSALVVVSAVAGTPVMGTSYNQGISSDGRHVFIRTNAQQFTGGASLTFQIGRRTLSEPVPGDGYTLVNTENGTTAGDGTDIFGGNSSDGNLVSLLIQSTNLLNGQGTVKVARRNISANSLTLVKGLSVFDLPVSPNQFAAISGDGATVDFSTPAYDALPGVFGQQVYSKKFPSGSLQLVSTGDGNAFGIASGQPLISGNGNFAVFTSSDARFVTNVRGHQAYRRNLTTGEIQLASSAVNAGVVIPSNSLIADVAISSTGRHIAFTTAATNLIAGVSGTQVYLKDMSTGTLKLVSQSTGEDVGNGASSSPSISADGKKVVFTSDSDNLASLGGSGGPILSNAQRVYLRNLDTSATTLVSATDAGVAADGNCYQPSISDAGDRAAFVCLGAMNLLGSTPSMFQQVFAKELDAGGAVSLISSLADGTTPGRGDSHSAKISANGLAYTFVSKAINFEDATSFFEVYRKVINASTAPKLVSRASGGAPANLDCSAPQISAAGDYILFASSGSNLATGISGEQVYRKNVTTGALALISTSGTLAGNTASAPGNLSALGDKILFSSSATTLIGGVSGSQVYLSVP